MIESPQSFLSSLGLHWMLVPSNEIIWPVEYYGEKHNTILDKQLFMYLYFDCS